MNRLTISLPQSVALFLRRESRRKHRPVSSLVREAVESHFAAAGVAQPALGFIALGRSGQRHTARQAKAILAAELGKKR